MSKRFKTKIRIGGLGIAAYSYIAIDYLRHVSPIWHERLQPGVWGVLALANTSLVFLLSALLFEVLIVTAVLGLDWHREMDPLPDPEQWLFLALNDKLPSSIVGILRFGHGVLHLYMFPIPSHPHSWAQTYYVPYSSDATAIWQLIQHDVAYVDYPGDHHPDWGSMSFLTDFIRPTASKGPAWYHLLTAAGGENASIWLYKYQFQNYLMCLWLYSCSGEISIQYRIARPFSAWHF
ncbi:hypothetical protein MKW92_049807 [Papaver armeniacum]|nr:hypothetical protein MKW92_049807 [Papaver armeniacum]